MSDNWKRGDLALCVANDFSTRNYPDIGELPRIGAIYGVNDVAWHSGLKVDGLALIGMPDDAYFEATAFRRINPHRPDMDDLETIRLLNADKVPAL
jgi:hypothetical protein